MARERELEKLVALLARAPAICYPSCLRCDHRSMRFPETVPELSRLRRSAAPYMRGVRPAPSKLPAADDTSREGSPALPPWKAFVVQFSLDSTAQTGAFADGVEHLGSARRLPFDSKADLLVVLERLLDDIQRVSK